MIVGHKNDFCYLLNIFSLADDLEILNEQTYNGLLDKFDNAVEEPFFEVLKFLL